VIIPHYIAIPDTAFVFTISQHHNAIEHLNLSVVESDEIEIGSSSLGGCKIIFVLHFLSSSAIIPRLITVGFKNKNYNVVRNAGF